MRLLNIKRWRRRRGYGVHSPFMYSLIRESMMERNFIEDNTELYLHIRAQGVSEGTSKMLQNIYSHCGLDSYKTISKAEDFNKIDCTARDVGQLYVIHQLPCEVDFEAIIDKMAGSNNIIAVLPTAKRSAKWIRRMNQELNCASLERRRMLLYFLNPNLKKQHYKL